MEIGLKPLNSSVSSPSIHKPLLFSSSGPITHQTASESDDSDFESDNSSDSEDGPSLAWRIREAITNRSNFVFDVGSRKFSLSNGIIHADNLGFTDCRNLVILNIKAVDDKLYILTQTEEIVL